MSEHADLEALSAYVDGEAPEWAAHVAACPSCRTTAEQLRAVAAAVATPVEAPDAAARDAAVTAALGHLRHRPPAERPASHRPVAERPASHRPVAERRPGRRRPYGWPLAAAAMVASVVGAVSLLSTTSTDRTTVAGPRPEADAQRESLSDTSAGSLPPTDLGDVPDAATLRARAAPALAATSAGATTSPVAAAPSAAESTGGTGDTGAPAAVGGRRAVTPDVIGTRPCEEQARAREPGLREVVYFATARRGEVPAVVLGFSTGPAPAPVTLLMLAQDGCSELLRAAGP